MSLGFYILRLNCENFVEDDKPLLREGVLHWDTLNLAGRSESMLTVLKPSFPFIP